jgi:hypothetical protein
MTADADHQRAKRELRLRIGRLRRRIDGRIRSVGREGRRLASWRAYVRRYPAHAVLAALGLGLTASGGLKGGWSRLLGAVVFRRTIYRVVDRVWRELEAICNESKPKRPTAEASGAEHGRP